MNLEEKVRKRFVYVPTPDIARQIEQGKQFIIVEDIPISSIPIGYTLIDMKFKDSSFKALIPQNLLFYMANPGEGNIDDALEQITGFYNNAKDYEDDFINEGSTSIQQASWSTLAKTSYSTYLINKLVSHKIGEFDKDGEPVAGFNRNILEKYGLNSPEVESRAKAIAALILNKDIKEIKEQNIDHILKHVTVTKELTQKEFKHITCWAGSHYELKDEYASQGYTIERQHNKDHRVGQKSESNYLFEGSVEKVEKEALYFMSQAGADTLHMKGLFRQYINLKYIAKEKPEAQLTIIPPGDKK